VAALIGLDSNPLLMIPWENQKPLHLIIICSLFSAYRSLLFNRSSLLSLLFSTHCSSLIAHRFFLIAHCSSLIAFSRCSSLIAHCCSLLLIAFFSLLIAHHSLLFFSLLIARCSLLFFFTHCFIREPLDDHFNFIDIFRVLPAGVLNFSRRTVLL
jgi:hypothetical protein